MTIAPAPEQPGVRAPVGARGLVKPALVVGGLAVATIALHVRDPHDQGAWGVCPTYALFGIYCPGCGGLRAVNDLSNLQIGAAASSNLLFVASLPLIAYVFARWSYGRWTGRAWHPSPRAVNATGVALGVLLVTFTLLRNTAVPWLAP